MTLEELEEFYEKNTKAQVYQEDIGLIYEFHRDNALNVQQLVCINTPAKNYDIEEYAKIYAKFKELAELNKFYFTIPSQFRKP